MAKIWVEICLISARGLRRTSSFWKLQWFAVGWIDPTNKYCTKIDACGNQNPVWKTKFAALVDDSNVQDLNLNVEVYSRDPLFLREKLQGTATIALKEFLSKYSKISDTPRPVTQEVGSYQLRKKGSNKPQGFVDISIHISEEGEGPSSFPGNDGEFVLTNSSNTIAISAQGGLGQAYPTPPLAQSQPPEHQLQTNLQYSRPVPFPANYSNPSVAGPSYPPAGGPGHHPPPPHTGYVPTFMPGTESHYINMPSSAAAPGRGPGPGLGVGVGAGALAAGAVIFGDDFMSGFNVPTGLQGPSLTISTDPPF